MNAMPATKRPTEHPEIEFPPVYGATLSHQELLGWAKDIKSLCRVDEVRVKGGSELHSEPGHAFSEAISELICHHLVAVQVRYVYGGQTYFDTCLSERGCFRLVRLLLQPG